VSSGGHTIDVDAGLLNRSLVLANQSIVGSVNANRRHYEAAAVALAAADHGWLEKVVSRSVPLDHFADAFTRQADDVKVVIEINQ
jgi:threonine dehydrogenase-like Zn-dependent dehydrogenase